MTTSTATLSLWPLNHLPMVETGDSLASLLLSALDAQGLVLQAGDLLVLAQKIVSKAEGRQIALAEVKPSAAAQTLALETDKDPRLVQLILEESTEVLRKKPGVLIVRHRLGLVGANAGIDQSNIDHGSGEVALLLPIDPDGSAALLRSEIEQRTTIAPAIIITDSMNRPWRLGTIGGAIGCAGLSVLDDYRGGTDLYGRELKVTLINRADALAGAATLLMGETTEKIPAVLVRGAQLGSDIDVSTGNDAGNNTAAAIVRPLDEDLFR